MNDLDVARVRQTATAVTVCVDIGAYDTLKDVFAPMVRIDYSSLWGGEAQTMSQTDLIAAWRSLVPGFDATWHEVGPMTVEVQGDNARASCPVDARHWLDGALWRVSGRYEFGLARDTRWRVTALQLADAEERGSRALTDAARERVATRGG